MEASQSIKKYSKLGYFLHVVNTGIITLVILLLSPFIIYYFILALKFSGIVQGDKMAPVGVHVGRTVAQGTGCYAIYCSGGIVYKLKPSTAEEINNRGFSFFDNLDKTQAKGYDIRGGWTECTTYEYKFAERTPCNETPSLSDMKIGNSKSLRAAMKNETYYVGYGHGKQYSVIIAPKAKLIFIGWRD